jgi:outer membrane immunogenic protein
MYVLGGLAVANYDDTFTEIGDDTFDMDGTYLGYVVGTGIEQAFTPNVTGRIEATYSAFGGDSVFGPATGDGPYRGHAQEASVRAGVNYYFGDRGSLGDGALAPTADWSGFYAGADLGFAHHMGQRFDRVYFEDGGNYDIPSFGGGAGVHAGHDWQNGHFVFGVLGDFAFYTNDEEDTSSGYREVHSALDWMATLRTRTGLATGNSLIYATGGLAVAEVELSHDDFGTPADSFNLDGTRLGGVFGLGVEHMINDRWSLKGEALYAKFLEKDAQNGQTCSDGLVTEPCEMHGYDENVTMKLGVSYRFGN